jgi:hypothetical protein
MRARTRITDITRTDLIKFYGGAKNCVVIPDIEDASLHHLDGNTANSVFQNLLPVGHHLHAKLKAKKQNWKLDDKLSKAKLTFRANEHFKIGYPTRSLGCMRLAYALYAHYQRDKIVRKQTLILELNSATHALYFLRRAARSCHFDIQNENSLIFLQLTYLLNKELRSTLKVSKKIPRYPVGELFIELGSWLNELGHPNEGVQLLRICKELMILIKDLGFNDLHSVARYQRQIANACVSAGGYEKEYREALQIAKELTGSDINNKCATLTIELRHLISRYASGKENTNFEKLYHHLLFDKVPKVQIHEPHGTDQTYLELEAHLLVCDSLWPRPFKLKYQKMMLGKRIRKLLKLETDRRISVVLDQFTIKAVRSAQFNNEFQEMEEFLQTRKFPVLNNKSKDAILAFAERLSTTDSYWEDKWGKCQLKS